MKARERPHLKDNLKPNDEMYFLSKKWATVRRREGFKIVEIKSWSSDRLTPKTVEIIFLKSKSLKVVDFTEFDSIFDTPITERAVREIIVTPREKNIIFLKEKTTAISKKLARQKSRGGDKYEWLRHKLCVSLIELHMEDERTAIDLFLKEDMDLIFNDENIFDYEKREIWDV